MHKYFHYYTARIERLKEGKITEVINVMSRIDDTCQSVALCFNVPFQA